LKLSLSTATCPFCSADRQNKRNTQRERKIVHRLKYSDIHLAYPDIDDFDGWVEMCNRCGIYFVNPRYDESEFELIYRNLSKKGEGASLVKRIASLPLKLALTYWHSSSSAKKMAARTIGLLLDPLLHIPAPSSIVPQNGRILDIGCGDSFHLRCFNSTGASLYATEIHSKYEPILSAGPENIRFWIKEFTSIDWEKETGYNAFDLIIFQSVFYRLNSPKQSLDLAWRLLKPGGSILRIEPYCPDLDSIIFMTKFSFPQGFTFVRDLSVYLQRLKFIYPDASFMWKIFYGRSYKMIRGKELGLLSAARDVVTRLIKTIFKTEPYYIRLDMIKPLD